MQAPLYVDHSTINVKEIVDGAIYKPRPPVVSEAANS